MIITESALNEAAEAVSKNPESLVVTYSEEYPEIMAYVFSESFELLTTDERKIYEYIVYVLLHTIHQGREESPDINPEQIMDAEEQNWSSYLSTGNVGFRKKLNPFFDGYVEEDGLAFIEDILTDDDEEDLTEEGKSWIFIGSKTILDVLAVMAAS